ncbi:MAG: hypothetical protein AAB885_02545 [Patescibacteria group bacterium]|mgnify:CR=1 FL=1
MKSLKQSLITIFVGLVMAAGVSFAASSWVGPTDSPPDGNAEAPVNVGPLPQIKNGILGANFLRSFYDTYLATNNGNVGIGTVIPTAKLDIDGQIKIRGGSPAAGKVLTSLDANGAAEWKMLPVAGGGLTYVGSCENSSAPSFCKCNNDETIMLLQGVKRQNYPTTCYVEKQGTLNVRGEVPVESSVCAFACFK